MSPDSESAPGGPRSERAALLAVAAALGAVALLHGWRALYPPPNDGSSTSRHLLFLAIDGGAAAGLVLRPRWFKWPFALLTAQQLVSHGSAGWRAWLERGVVDYESIAVVIVMPLTLWLLFRDSARGTRRV